MKNDTQEAILRVRGHRDFKKSRDDGVINTFMAQYPKGDLRKSNRHPGGCEPHKRPNRKKKSTPNVVSLSDRDSEGQLSEEEKNINLSAVSTDSDWTSDDDNDDDDE